MLRKGHSAVLATVIYVQGSAPRNPGTKMIVTDAKIYGTIGGGNFEYLIAEQSRKLIQNSEKNCLVQHYPLGPLTRQCCGGRVSMLLEKFTPEMADAVSKISHEITENQASALVSDVNRNQVFKQVTQKDIEDPILYRGDTEFSPKGSTPWETGEIIRFVEPLIEAQKPLYVFGAGHVGRAVIRLLSELPFSVTWVDMRAEEFPDSIPNNVSKTVTNNPTDFVNSAPAGSFYLVFTHSHELDFEITAAILDRGDSGYCGLIASETKRSRFMSRFSQEKKLLEPKLAKLTSPIGLPTIAGKAPEFIAVSVCAQLLMEVEKEL